MTSTTTNYPTGHNHNPDMKHLFDWVWKIVIALSGVAMAYLQMQTNLSVITLELKLEKQRVEDMLSRPSNKDLERIEKQMEEIKAIVNRKGNN